MQGIPKRPRDTNQLAKLIVDLTVGDEVEPNPNEGKDPEAVESGRKGGKVGGKRRMASLTPQERKAMGLAAATARWSKRKA